METPDAITPIAEQAATVLDRVRYLIHVTHSSQAKFARQLGMNPSGLSRVLSGNLPASESFINRIVVSLGVSKDWLVSGRGVPFAKGAGSPTVISEFPDMAGYGQGAPVYDVDATAGALPLSNELTTQNIIGYIKLPQLNPSNPVVRVSGDSMVPKIPNGSFVSIREIRDPSILSWGSIYLVELEDYRMVKYVRRHADPDKIILHSENSDYDDIEVAKSAVIRFFLVEQIFNFDILS